LREALLRLDERDPDRRLEDLRVDDARLLPDVRLRAGDDRRVDLRAVVFFAALLRDVLFFALELFAALLRFVPVDFFAAFFFGGPPPPSRALFSAMAIACFCAFFLLDGRLVPIEPFRSYECISLLMLLLIVPRLEPFFKGMMCSFQWYRVARRAITRMRFARAECRPRVCRTK
jgi:hypothetical protein